MSEPITNPAVQEPTPGNGGEVTFTQAEVDALISKEKARALSLIHISEPTRPY